MNKSFDQAFEDDIKQVLAEVPAPVRAFFASGKVSVISKNLIQKYQLHIDQGAVVGREIILLLLGINTPEEFTKALAEEARISHETIDNIVQDINTQIFIPLREEEERQSKTAAMPQPPKPAEVIRLVVPQASPPQKVVPPAEVKLPQVPQNKFPDRKLLKDHEEPHIEFRKAPTQTTEPTSQRTVSPPKSIVFPASIAPAVSTTPAPAVPTVPATPAAPQIPPTPSATPQVLPTPPKAYSADPYREPIDEK